MSGWKVAWGAARAYGRTSRAVSESMQASYERHAIEHLPLYDFGYPSIGCEPCTAIPAAGADARSGRWGGRKLECGIHTESKRADE